MVTFEITVWHIKEALRGVQPTKSRRVNRRLELGNRKLEVESIPVFLSTLLPIAIQMQIWMLRQNRHTTQRNLGLRIYIIIIHFGLNFYIGEIFLNNFVMLTLTSSISSLQTKREQNDQNTFRLLKQTKILAVFYVCHTNISTLLNTDRTTEWTKLEYFPFFQVM